MCIYLEKNNSGLLHTVVFMVLIGLAGCAPHIMELPKPIPEPDRAEKLEVDQIQAEQIIGKPKKLSIERLSGVSAKEKRTAPVQGSSALQLPTGKLMLNVDAMPLNRFVHMALGEVLGLNFDIHATIAKRTDKVTLHVSVPVEASDLLAMIEQALSLYNVGLMIQGDVVRVVSSASLRTEAPAVIDEKSRLLIRMGRTIEFIPLFHATPNDVLRFIPYFMNVGAGENIIENSRLNAVMAIGSSDRIARLRKAVRLIDRPAFQGMKLSIIRPVFWQAAKLAKVVEKTMKAKGLTVNQQGGIHFIAVEEINAIVVVSPDSARLQAAEQLMAKLDAVDDKVADSRHFIYFVRYTDASRLGDVIGQVLGQAAAAPAASSGDLSAANSKAVSAPAASVARALGGDRGKVIIDKGRNALIFIGSASEYRNIHGLLKVLDRAPRQVLIEATIADITLDDSHQLGVEWAATNVDNSTRYSGTLSTLGGLGLGTAGITYSLLNNAGLVRAKINALATKGHARILSTPTLLAMDGEEAKIQVGTQVSVVTSEISDAAAIGGAGSTGLLRTFEYIDTGVILKIRPSITEEGVVHLKLYQEVSEPGSSNNNTPPISKRTVETILSVPSGQTIMIGGLITHNKTDNRTQVPFLGDIPLLGQLFSSNTVTDRSTEMIVLITPHVIYGPEDAEFITNSFRNKLGWMVEGDK